MLSVLSSGTLSLSEELQRLRLETHALRSENSHLLENIHVRRGRFFTQMDWAWADFGGRSDQQLVRGVFAAFADNRSRGQVLRLPANGRAESGGLVPHSNRRCSAWLWLWKRKLLSSWRRALEVERRRDTERRHREEVSEVQGELQRCQAVLASVQLEHEAVCRDLVSERQRVSQLEASLGEAETTVSELKGTLKDSYMRQFEEAHQRQALEQRFSTVVGENAQMRVQRSSLNGELDTKREELLRAEALQNEREQRLVEASGELSLAEEVIDDITSSKCQGLRRFFERYNLPVVLMALFRKVVELNAKAHSNGSMMHAASNASLASGNSECLSPRIGTRGSLSLLARDPLEFEVKHNMSTNGLLSKCALQAYIEGLHLGQACTTAMVTQVILGLLDINLGEGHVEPKRFAMLLSSPPPWEQLDFATALWGAVGEPAAVVQQHRRSSALKGLTGSGVANASGPRASVRSPPGSPHASLRQRRATSVGLSCVPGTADSQRRRATAWA